MRKLWKIVIGVIIFVGVIFIGIVIYNGYDYYKFYDRAENLGSVIFGSWLFNEKLKTCELAYADTWEIIGIEEGNCIVSFEWSSEIGENFVRSDPIICELPPEVYSVPEEIVWREMVSGEGGGGEYCKLNV